VDAFCRRHCDGCGCVLAIPGALHLALASTVGMEGDVTGYIVAPVLIVVALLYIVTWYVAVNAALEYRQLMVVSVDDDNDNSSSCWYDDDGTGNVGIACTSLA
jgi:hypothetical protein